jgi:hypothetical protein
MTTKLYIDPPSGWKYGFPKPAPDNLTKMNQAQLNQWFIENGYPEIELNSFKYGMPFRVIEGDYE